MPFRSMERYDRVGMLIPISFLTIPRGNFDSHADCHPDTLKHIQVDAR
jgi:hypothetical protein